MVEEDADEGREHTSRGAMDTCEEAVPDVEGEEGSPSRRVLMDCWDSLEAEGAGEEVSEGKF